MSVVIFALFVSGLSQASQTGGCPTQIPTGIFEGKGTCQSDTATHECEFPYARITNGVNMIVPLFLRYSISESTIDTKNSVFTMPDEHGQLYQRDGKIIGQRTNDRISVTFRDGEELEIWKNADDELFFKWTGFVGIEGIHSAEGQLVVKDLLGEAGITVTPPSF